MLNDSIKSLTMYRLLIRRLRSQFMVPFSPVQCRVKRVCCEKLTCSGRLSDGGLHVDFDDAETKHIGCFSSRMGSGHRDFEHTQCLRRHKISSNCLSN